jgi:Tfp pilus assembly protein PilN
VRPINLLPAGIAEERVRRRRVYLIIAAIAVYVFALVVGVFYWNTKVDGKVRLVQEQEQLNDAKQAEIDALSSAGQLQDEYYAKRALVAVALTGEVDWGAFVNDLAAATPPTVWLNNMNGATTEAPVADLLAQVSFSGNGITGYGDVAAWVRNLDSTEYANVTGVWVPNAARSLGPPVLVTFTSTAVLNAEAGTNRIETLTPELGVP